MKETKLSLAHDYFETVIMYKCLTDESYLASTVEYLKPEYFVDKNKQVIIGIIQEFFLNRGTVPTTPEIKSYLTTSDLKTAFKSIVSEFTDFSKKINEDELYTNTETFLKEKAAFRVLYKASDDFSKGQGDPSQLLKDIESVAGINLMHDMGFDYFNSIDKHIENITKVESYLSSGWKWLDKKLGGGFLKDGRALYVFAGQTNIGKSIFLGNIAANIAEQGKTVLLITLEMPEHLYAKRLSGRFSQMPINSFVQNANELKDKLFTYKGKHPNARLIIKEFPPSTMTPVQISAYMRKLKQMGINIDAIVVDYLNLLVGVGNNSYEKVKYVSEQMRALTYIYHCPMISATQLNRSGVNQAEPGVETTSESMGLPMTVDGMFALWQEPEDQELSIIKMSIIKNRFGPNFGTIPMRIDYTTLTLTEEMDANETSEIVNTSQTLDMLTKL